MSNAGGTRLHSRNDSYLRTNIVCMLMPLSATFVATSALTVVYSLNIDFGINYALRCPIHTSKINIFQINYPNSNTEM